MPKLDKSGKLYSVLRRIRRRIRSASTAQILLDVFALIAGAVQVVLPVLWAAQKASSLGRVWLEVIIFLLFVVFSLVHRHFLSRLFKPRRVVEEEQRRPLRLSEAISKFTLASVSSNKLTLTRISEIERSLLENIKSEIEAVIGDVTGSYVMVNLLISNPHNPSQMLCINRTDTARKFPKAYPKPGMHAWDCLDSGIEIYVPNFCGNERYKCILCLPLYYTADESSTEWLGLGVVTVDHAVEHEFDGLIERLKVNLSPYLRFLELALIWRSQLNSGGPRTRTAGKRN